MMQYMLDTNTVSHLIRAHPGVKRRVVELPMGHLCISSTTAGELIFGLAKRTDAKRLHNAAREFLKRVEVLPWDGAVAECYGNVRADMESTGRVLAPLDMLIAAHALATNTALVTSDHAFAQVNELQVEDWTA